MRINENIIECSLTGYTLTGYKSNGKSITMSQEPVITEFIHKKKKKKYKKIHFFLYAAEAGLCL